MWHVLWKKISRELTIRLAFFLSPEDKRKLERRLRGKEEKRKLDLADAVIVSFGKSGRTWLRMLMSRFYQQRYHLSDAAFIGFDNLTRKDSHIPRLFFTHDNYLKDYTGNVDDKRDFYGKKVVLLVRDPRDTAVSQFFQWKYRMREAKKGLNDYPDHGADMSVYDFVMHDGAGMPKVIRFLNDWAREIDSIGDVLIVRYEDLRSDTAGELGRVLRFVGADPTAEELADCVEFASVENMRKLEEKRVFWAAGSRMKAKDRDNPNSYKVRRAKVGGYRDYFEDGQIETIEAMIDRDLLPGFRYGRNENADRNEAVGA
ncbi:MAG: sulfotransferase domain-containing protein [Geminicoccaceae bacterium]|nr:sulfotransferase domain-containing protein [Geminicoccaceae bacterium]